MSFIWKGHFNRRNANVCDSDRTHSHLWRTRSHFLICMTFSRALPRSIKGLVVDYKWEPWRTTWMCIFTHSRVWVVCLLRDSSSITCEDRDVPDGWRKGLIHVCLLRDSSSITSQDRDVTYGCGTWLIRVCPWRESSSSTNEDCGVTKGCRTWLIHVSVQGLVIDYKWRRDKWMWDIDSNDKERNPQSVFNKNSTPKERREERGQDWTPS